MEAEYVTTPFGRRPMTLAMLMAQRRAEHGKPIRSADKWKIYRALCEAKPLLGVTDRALAVLNALLSFYPKNELSDDANLIVFPSNAQLSLRAHGMAEQTIRRHPMANAMPAETGQGTSTRPMASHWRLFSHARKRSNASQPRSLPSAFISRACANASASTGATLPS